jgi:hypothetical protein
MSFKHKSTLWLFIVIMSPLNMPYTSVSAQSNRSLESKSQQLYRQQSSLQIIESFMQDIATLDPTTTKPIPFIEKYGRLKFPRIPESYNSWPLGQKTCKYKDICPDDRKWDIEPYRADIRRAFRFIIFSAEYLKSENRMILSITFIPYYELPTSITVIDVQNKFGNIFYPNCYSPGDYLLGREILFKTWKSKQDEISKNDLFNEIEFLTNSNEMNDLQKETILNISFSRYFQIQLN